MYRTTATSGRRSVGFSVWMNFANKSLNVDDTLLDSKQKPKLFKEGVRLKKNTNIEQFSVDSGCYGSVWHTIESVSLKI